MDALWKAIEMEKAKANDPRLSKIERAETLRVRLSALATSVRCRATPSIFDRRRAVYPACCTRPR